MKNKIELKTKTAIIISIAIVVLIVSNAYALFTSDPQINPSNSGSLYTYENLDCKWTIDSSVDVNITWYKNGVLNKIYNRSCTANTPCTTEGSGIVSHTETTKGDTWTCEVAYFNGTGIEIKNNSRAIADAPPTTPRVFLENTEILNNTIANITEDYITIFQINSTDADNDVLTYTNFIGPAFCSLNSNTGELTCSPTEESDIGLRNATVFASSELQSSGFRFSINTTANNDAPYFSPALQNQSIFEGNSLSYAVSGLDDENNIPFSFSINSDLGSSLIITSTSNNTASITLNHSGQNIAQYSDRGNHTITVNITDNYGASTINTFNLEVKPTNHLANISIYVEDSQSLIQGGSLIIRINATDIDNDTLTFNTNNLILYNIYYGSTDKTNPNGTSSSNATIFVPLLTNDYVINNQFTISVFDSKQNSTSSVTLNITNTNDAPELHEMSVNQLNTLNNTNISTLLAYTGVLFNYYVNATDIDSTTYMGETLSYSTNDSAFPIDSSTGLITFTKFTSGTFYVQVNVTDLGGLTDTINAVITIADNLAPYFTIIPLSFTCAEYDANNYPFNCIINISQYSNDSDVGDYVSTYYSNSTLFDINSTTGMIDFRSNQSQVGNYSILLNITDSRGGINSTILFLAINNTNNNPIITSITAPESRMSIDQSYNYGIIANDSDLELNTYENLTFNYSITGPSTDIFMITKTDNKTAVFSVNPIDSNDAGNYTVILIVKDYYNKTANNTINFYLYNITIAPNITNIKPYGTPLFNSSINDSWINKSLIGSSTTVYIYENTTYIFNQTTTYDTQYQNSLSYNWNYDGVSVSSASSLSRNFNFFSNGTHNLTFTATDEFNKSTAFSWIITVANVNRPPILINPLTNLTGIFAVNGTTTYASYTTYHSSQAKFYDPDNDFDLDSIVDDNESTMSFTVSTCPYATFTFINNALKVNSIAVGTCLVNFTAIDSDDVNARANSTNILINITYVSNETITEEVPITRSGGGGGSSRTITIPIPEEVEKPKPLEIITPKLVTLYRNATVTVPILLNNTWNDTLEGITLSAETNASNVSIYLDRTYFPRMATGATEEVILTIANYKSEGHYEIQVRAKIIDPDFTDTATIYVNSADTKSEGESLDAMISFARDLLSSNPECQELTELLNEAKKQLTVNNYEATAKLVDSVINGCKYLVNSDSQTEKPSKDFIKRFNWKSIYNEYLIIGGFAILFIIAVYYIIKKDKHEDS